MGQAHYYLFTKLFNLPPRFFDPKNMISQINIGPDDISYANELLKVGYSLGFLVLYVDIAIGTTQSY